MGTGGAGVGVGVGVLGPAHRCTQLLEHASNADAGLCGQSAMHALSEPPGQSPGTGVGAGGVGVGGGVGVPGAAQRCTQLLEHASNAAAGLCGQSAIHALSEPPGQSSEAMAEAAVARLGARSKLQVIDMPEAGMPLVYDPTSLPPAAT